MSIEVIELQRKQNELALKQIAGKAHNIQSNPSGPNIYWYFYRDYTHNIVNPKCMSDNSH